MEWNQVQMPDFDQKAWVKKLFARLLKDVVVKYKFRSSLLESMKMMQWAVCPFLYRLKVIESFVPTSG